MTPNLSQGAEIAADKLREIVDDIGPPTGLTIDVSDGFLHSICTELLATRAALAARIVPEKLVGELARWAALTVGAADPSLSRVLHQAAMALATPPVPNVPPQVNEGVAIKPLEWCGEEGWEWRSADALFGGWYTIKQYDGDPLPWVIDALWMSGPELRFATLDEAKAAAQADYEQRIRSALVSPSPATAGAGEPLKAETGWLCEWLHATGPEWWTLGGEDGGYFAKDSLKALRFARKQDAQAYIDEAGWTEIVPTEHEWGDYARQALGDRS